MFGWEFPPHISGGLGTACFGLTKALAKQKIDLLFVVPKAFGDEDNSRYAQSLPKAYIFDGMQSYVDLMIMPVRSGYSSDEIDGVLKTAERYPIFFMLLRAAELLAVNGEVDKALEKLNAIKYLHTAEQLDFTLNYLSDKTEEHPEYVVLIERLNMQ